MQKTIKRNGGCMMYLKIEKIPSTVPNHLCFCVTTTPNRYGRSLHYRYIAQDAYNILEAEGKGWREIVLRFAVPLKEA